MTGVLDHDSALVRLDPGQPGLMKYNIAMNHAPGSGSIARPFEQQSSALPLYHGCPKIKCLLIPGLSSDFKGCQNVTYEGWDAEVCHCQGSKCNSAPKYKPTLIGSFLLVGLTILEVVLERFCA